MLNPLIVFFKQHETSVTLPIAYDANGLSFNPTSDDIACREAALIILNEDANVPAALKYTNKTCQNPISVIWHNYTEEKRNALYEYGTPISLASFSHVSDNSIFADINSLLTENSPDLIKRFVAEWQSRTRQLDLNELAAIITYFQLLSPEQRSDEAIYQRYEQLTALCHNPEEIFQLVDSQRYVEVLHKLEQLAGQGT